MKVAHLLMLALSGNLGVSTALLSDGSAQSRDIHVIFGTTIHARGMPLEKALSTHTATRTKPDRYRTRTGKVVKPKPAETKTQTKPDRYRTRTGKVVKPKPTDTSTQTKPDRYRTRTGKVVKPKPTRPWRRPIPTGNPAPAVHTHPDAPLFTAIPDIPNIDHIGPDPAAFQPTASPLSSATARPIARPIPLPSPRPTPTPTPEPTPIPPGTFSWIPRDPPNPLSEWERQSKWLASIQQPTTYTSFSISKGSTITIKSTWWPTEVQRRGHTLATIVDERHGAQSIPTTVPTI